MSASENRNGYIVVDDCKLVIQYHLDQLVLEGLISLKTKMMNDAKFNPSYSFLIDLRSTRIDNTMDEILAYANWLKSNFTLKGEKKLAMIISTPQQSAILKIFSTQGKPDPLNYKMFSEVGNAIAWLGIPQESHVKILDLIDSTDTIDHI